MAPLLQDSDQEYRAWRPNPTPHPGHRRNQGSWRRRIWGGGQPAPRHHNRVKTGYPAPLRARATP